MRVFWTGFGPFGEGSDRVEENPTQRLVRALQEEFGDDSSEVVCVAREDCDDVVARLVDSADLVVHLGVDTNATSIKLEKYAYNESNFRCPDERGAQPVEEKVDDDLELGARRGTSVDVEQLASDLGARGCKVSVSENPGRFICCYLYYKSLKARSGTNTLFVHVPPFGVVPERDQLETLRCLRTLLNPLITDIVALGIDRSEALKAVFAGRDSVEAAMSFLFEEDEDFENSSIQSDEVKMVLVVRTDLSMSHGKIAAQSVHAALGAYRSSTEIDPVAAATWVQDGEKVVVTRAPQSAGAPFLYQRASKAHSLGLAAYVVADAGRTQVDPGTETVLAVGPGLGRTVDQVTGDLRLL